MSNNFRLIIINPKLGFSLKMDTKGGSWENDPRESQECLSDAGSERTHQYYCPFEMGGICSCSEEENLNNNNDYSSMKKPSKSRKSSSRCSGGYCDGPSPYDSHNYSRGRSSYAGNNSCLSCCQPPSYPTSSGQYQQPTGETSCRYCQYNVSSNQAQCSQCTGCNMQPNNSTYCDYYDSSKTYGSASYAPPKIQVTAKILFGTVSAITNLKQKKSSKKS